MARRQLSQWVLLLALIICMFALIAPGSEGAGKTGGKTATKSNLNKTATGIKRTERKGDKAKGVSRISGGLRPFKPPPFWLGTLWHSTDRFKTDDRFAGHAIQLNSNHFIANSITIQKILREREIEATRLTESKEPVHKVGNDDSIDINEPFSFWEKTFSKQVHSFEPKYFDSPPTLGLYKFSGRAKIENSNAKYPTFETNGTSYPYFEENKKELGSNCTLHGFGFKSSNKDGKPEYNKTERVYQVMKLKMDHKKISKSCNCVGECELEIDFIYNTTDPSQWNWPYKEHWDAVICPGRAWFGAPVLCGPDNKLTYLAAHQNYKHDTGKCTRHFKAYHVANFYEQMKYWSAHEQD